MANDHVEIKDLTQGTPGDSDWAFFQEASGDQRVLKTPKSELKGEKGDKGDTGATGPQGEQGPQGIQGEKGDKGLNWQGQWSAGTYQADDAVEHNGSSWVATTETTEEPSGSATDWDLLAAKGEQGDTGAQGAQGEQGPAGTDGTSFTWRGEWNSATSYDENDIVEYSGSSYVAVSANTNKTPGTDPEWELMAERGADGEGSGDVSGPASSTNDNIAVFDGTTGKLLKDGAASIAAIRANATNVGATIHGATAKTTPHDDDTVALIDSEASNVLKKLSWANIKSAIQTFIASATMTLTNKTISTADNTITAATASSDGIVTTTTQTFAGQKTFNNGIYLNQGINTGLVTQGFHAHSPTSTFASSTSAVNLAGAGSTSQRVTVRYSNSASIAENAAYATLILGQVTVLESSSGNHPLISQLAIKPLNITNGSATVSDTATFYIENAASATVSGGNYALWVDGGISRFDGAIHAEGASGIFGILDMSNIASSDKTFTFPNRSGTVALENHTINAQTGTTYTLALSDAHGVVELTNGSAITLTVPPNSSVAFPTGTKIALFQGGAGQVTIAPGSGVTLKSYDSALKLAGQEAGAVLIKVDTDTWRVEGNLTT